MSLGKSVFSSSVAHPVPDKAAFVLRVALGVVLLAHGLLKLLVFGLAGSAGFFTSVGLPDWLVVPVIAIEVIGGGAIVLGLWVRLLALVSAVLLLGTVYVHAPNGWLFSSANGGWEYPLFLTVAAIAVAIAGEGAWALRIPSSAKVAEPEGLAGSPAG